MAKTEASGGLRRTGAALLAALSVTTSLLAPGPAAAAGVLAPLSVSTPLLAPGPAAATGVLAPLSVSTPLLAPGPAAATATLAPPRPALTQTAPHPCPPPPASMRPADLKAWKDQMADQMLARAANGRPISADVARNVRADVSLLPAEVIALLARNQTGITVKAAQESLHDLGLIREIDPAADFADLTALRGVIDAALHASDAEYETRLQAIDRELAPLATLKEDEETDGELFSVREDLLTQRATLLNARANAFYRRVEQATDGRVESHQVVDLGLGEATPWLGPMLSRLPVTLDMLASIQGARTPQEKAEMIALIRGLNGDRLRAAQDEFERQVPPEERAPAGAPESERPFLPLQSRIVMPAFYFVRDAANPNAPAKRLSGHDAISLDVWQRKLARGQYFSTRGRNTVVVGDEHLGKRPDGRSVLVHELGHAFEHAMQKLEPSAWSAYASKRDESHRRLRLNAQGFVSEYAAASPEEMAAETFGFIYSGSRERMRDVDARWKHDLGALVQQGQRSGSVCLKR